MLVGGGVCEGAEKGVPSTEGGATVETANKRCGCIVGQRVVMGACSPFVCKCSGKGATEERTWFGILRWVSQCATQRGEVLGQEGVDHQMVWRAAPWQACPPEDQRWSPLSMFCMVV